MSFDVLKIQSQHIAVVIGFLLPTMCSGILYLFLFNRELFLAMDTFKMLLTSFAITSPIWVVNTFIIAFYFGQKKKRYYRTLTLTPAEIKKHEEDDKQNFEAEMRLFAIMGGFFSIFIFFIPVVIKVFVDISLQSAIYWATGIQIFMFLLYILSFLSLKKMPTLAKSKIGS